MSRAVLRDEGCPRRLLSLQGFELGNNQAPTSHGLVDDIDRLLPRHSALCSGPQKCLETVSRGESRAERADRLKAEVLDVCEPLEARSLPKARLGPNVGGRLLSCS